MIANTHNTHVILGDGSQKLSAFWLRGWAQTLLTDSALLFN